MPTLIFSAPYMISSVERFRPVFTHYGLDLIVPIVHERLSEEEILVFAGQFDGAICGDDHYTRRIIEACLPRLKVISKWGTGIDSIDREAASQYGIRVGNTPNAFTLPVSDSVMGYILSFARQLPWMDRAVKAGDWSKKPGRSLSECTLGVVGVGNVGKAVLRRARSFGMTLLGNDIIPIAPDFILENGVEMTSLTDLLARSDFISLNCDLNPTSFHIFNAQSLEWIKPGAVLINTARGALVEESALVTGLQSGILAGAALDVYEVEPLPSDSSLRRLDQVMLAAHNANSSPTAWERVHWNTIHNLLEGLGIPHDDLKNFRIDSALG
jgi:D-3-phosphoglycerate dehydrogenase / 2-oxoglutarate reductase